MATRRRVGCARLAVLGREDEARSLAAGAGDQTVDDPANFRVVTLDSLLLMKLMSNRRKDHVHVQGLVNVGLIVVMAGKSPPQLAARFREILTRQTADGIHCSHRMVR